MQNKHLTIGYITATHGLRGGLRVKPATTFIEERFKVNKKVLVTLKDTSEIQTLTIKTIHENKGFLILSFKELTTIEEAEPFVKGSFLVLKEKATLEDGFFLFDDLLGLNIVLEDGSVIGNVHEILEYASYHTLRVKRENKSDLLIPYIEEFIISTDLVDKKIVFRPIEGML